MGEVVQIRKDEMKISDAMEQMINYVKLLETKVETLQEENSKMKDINPMTRMFDELPDVLKAEDIAGYMRISRYRVYEYLKTSPEYGGIKSFVSGRTILCMKYDFAEWLDRQRNEHAHGVRKQARER